MNCICGKSKFISVTKRKEREIVKCKFCGFERVKNIPNRKESTNLIKNLETNFLEEYLEEENSYKQYFQNKLEQIKRFKNPKTALDIGCGAGVFLDVCLKCGIKISGADLSAAMVRHCKNNGYKVVRNNIYDSYFDGKKFDMVSGFQVIEHVIDPIKFIKRISALIKNDGLLVITTPDVEGFSAKLQGKGWFEYHNLEHNFFFNKKSLEILLKKSGFKILCLETENSRKFTIRYVLNRLKKYYYTDTNTIQGKLFSMIDTEKFRIFDSIKLREPNVNIFVVAKKI